MDGFPTIDCLKLFNALHLEATDITEADIQNITMSDGIVDKPKNDLEFYGKGQAAGVGRGISLSGFC